MRTAFNTNEQVIKVFNEQSQYEGRANRLYFEGDILYSYGRHYPLAIFTPYDFVLINDDGYSPTTNKHIGLARAIVKSKKQMLLSQIDLIRVSQQLEQLYTRLSKARKPHIYATAINDLYQTFNENMAYIGGFIDTRKSPFSGVYFERVLYNDKTEKQHALLNRCNEIHAHAIKFI